jgi:hypothetical protein
MAALHLGSEGYSTDGTNGRVGIGTSNPAQELTVSGTIRALYSGENRYRSDHFVGSDHQGHLNAYDDTGSVYLPLCLDGSSLILNSASGGNVGIGCTSPDHKLSVSDTSSGLVTQAIFGQDKTSGQSQIAIGEQDASDKSLNIGFDHANSYGYMQVSGSDIGSGIVITNTESEKVGVGTTSPDTKLHVNGAITLGAAGGPQIKTGGGAPNNNDGAPVGSLYLNTNGGANTTLYVKTASNVWTAK